MALLIFILYNIFNLVYADINTKIIGGHEAKLGQFKHIASIRNNDRHFCAGTIISAKTILTAAHCNIGPIEEMTAVVGTINISTGGDSYYISQFIEHGRFNLDTLENDIGLVILSSEIMFKIPTVQPIRLPLSDIGDDKLVTFSGWGLTTYPGYNANKLQYIYLKTINFSKCQSLHPARPVLNTQICTLTKTGEGFCLGDSGGPLEANNQLHGIASFAYPCGIGRPDFYTRVFLYKPWIEDNMQ